MPVRIAVRDLGPITAADVEIRPLTVLVGPNNSGKSVLAVATYACASARPFLSYSRSGQGFVFIYFGSGTGTILRPTRIALEGLPRNRRDQQALLSEIDDILVDDNSRTGVSSRLLALLTRWFEQILEAYGESVLIQLERGLGARPSELGRRSSRRKSDRWSVSVEGSKPRWRVDIDYEAGKSAVSVTIPDVSAIARTALQQLRGFEWESPGFTHEPDTPDFMLEALINGANTAIFGQLPDYSHYLPAARSGILHSHRALASSVVARSTMVGVEEWQIPKLSGVITDFISRLLTLEPRDEASLEQVARHIERHVLRGHIEIESEPPSYPEISFQASGLSLPLSRTSSMVSEMAPIVLYIRNVLDPGELLIIEEPESHLHPGSQLALAKGLVRLVNEGVHVVLTTHSDYFLTQINNSIVASAAQSSSFGDFLPRQERLTTRDVSAYVFDPSGQGGTHVRRLRVTRKEGFSDREFASVAEVLYNEAARLAHAVEAPAE